ncbi:hypothetical protein [Colwellia sp. E2M01]|uniref:hypothetical protein n=1 Tax=Colwellia sp. E2M01 TaxID=2841561 RepID=UPI001C092542|nr:hypothetical protein [Colwellia sp. E2M01]MBU2869827.1 hypothetical protein [Colwellia sp. E2M01]
MSKKVCPTIIGLEFDTPSKEAIQSINNILESKNTGLWVSSIGHLLLIFGGLAVQAKNGGTAIENTHIFKVISRTPNQTSYNIYSINWEYFFKAFTALDKFANNQIETIAGLQVLRGNITAKERSFWKAVYSGCKVK